MLRTTSLHLAWEETRLYVPSYMRSTGVPSFFGLCLDPAARTRPWGKNKYPDPLFRHVLRL